MKQNTVDKILNGRITDYDDAFYNCIKDLNKRLKLLESRIVQLENKLKNHHHSKPLLEMRF